MLFGVISFSHLKDISPRIIGGIFPTALITSTKLQIPNKEEVYFWVATFCI